MDSISSIFSLAISSNVFFTSELFIGFLLGVIPSVSTLIYKECIKKIKIKKLIQLHHETYINPIIDSLESVLFENNLDKNVYIYEFRKLSDEIGISIKNIDFSLNNEYSVLNSDHTFELIRTAEFTKKILMEIRKQLNYFASLAVQREEKKVADYMNGALEKILKMIELNWEKNTDYIYLKRLDIFSENKTEKLKK